MEAVRDSATAVSALQRPVNPVRGLAGAGCITLWLINVDRGSYSTVGFPKRVKQKLFSNPQRLMKAVEHSGSPLQRLVKPGSG